MCRSGSEAAAGGERRVRLLIGLGALLMMCGAAVRAEPDGQLGALVSPGRLTRAHADLEGIRSCRSCHEAGRQVAAAKCLSCHKPIAQRIAAKTGVHRAVTTDCVSCHVEHMGVDAELRPFAVAGFDHARDAAFALDGRHAAVATTCAACHKSRSFLTLSSTCASCHQDVHKGALGNDCARCHTTRIAFKDTIKSFDHSRTAYPLAGAHTTVTCRSCHASGKTYGSLKFGQCSACHQDPHRPDQGPACSTCHTATAWRATRVDHSKTAFPLLGRHIAVTCKACHTQPAMKVKPRADRCDVCHADPHRAAFKPKDCNACHTSTSFRKGAFDHATTRFALTGQHARTTCESCHKRPASSARRTGAAAVDFKGLHLECASCHDDVHRNDLGAACQTCHSTATFKTTTFTHAGARAFYEGAHAKAACDGCHKPAAVSGPARAPQGLALRVRFTAADTACASCHTDVHLGQVGVTCERCHAITAPKFALAGFGHSATKFPLTGKHEPLACASCHTRQTATFPAGTGTAIRLTGFAAGCAACHKDPHLGQLSQTCETCHTPAAFAIRAYEHRNRALRGFFVGRHAAAACSKCHLASRRQFPAGQGTAVDYATDSRCVACHVDVHRGQLGSRCIDCHKP